MNKKDKWKEQKLDELETEARKIIKRIEVARGETAYWQSRGWAALKRCTLDLNAVGVDIRNGFYKSPAFINRAKETT